MTSRVERLTVSVPRELVAVADEIAGERGLSRSKLVSQCLEELARQRLQAKMEEGYRDLAKENRQFARDTQGLANEVLADKND